MPLDRRPFHDALGLILDPLSNMDLSTQRNRWSHALSDSGRGSFLLHHPDLQYLTPVPIPQQTNFPPSLPSRSETAE